MALAPRRGRILEVRDKPGTTRSMPLILRRTDWTSHPGRTRAFEASAGRERQGWSLRDSLARSILPKGRRGCVVVDGEWRRCEYPGLLEPNSSALRIDRRFPRCCAVATPPWRRLGSPAGRSIDRTAPCSIFWASRGCRDTSRAQCRRQCSRLRRPGPVARRNETWTFGSRANIIEARWGCERARRHWQDSTGRGDSGRKHRDRQTTIRARERMRAWSRVPNGYLRGYIFR